jgi:hypothetical protein
MDTPLSFIRSFISRHHDSCTSQCRTTIVTLTSLWMVFLLWLNQPIHPTTVLVAKPAMLEPDPLTTCLTSVFVQWIFIISFGSRSHTHNSLKLLLRGFCFLFLLLFLLFFLFFLLLLLRYLSHTHNSLKLLLWGFCFLLLFLLFLPLRPCFLRPGCFLLQPL